MSEKHNADEITETNNSDSVNRRRFVKTLGAAGGVAAGFSVLPGTSKAEEVENRSEIRTISGERLDKLSAIASDFEQFHNLRNRVERDHNIQVKIDSKQGAETVDQDGNPYQVVNFPLEFTDSTETGGRAGISVSLRDGSYLNATASVSYSESKTNDIEIESYEAKPNAISASANTVNTSEISTESVRSKSQMSCGNCMIIADYACAVGCNVSLDYICSLAGIAGVGCAGAVAVICQNIVSNDLCHFQAGQCKACKRAGFCNPNDCGGPYQR